MLEMFKLLKIERRCMPYFPKQFITALSLMSHGGGELDYSKCPIFETKDAYRSNDLSPDKIFGVLSHGGNKNLAGLANFEFRIL